MTTRRAGLGGRVPVLGDVLAALAVLVAVELTDLARSVDGTVLDALVTRRTPSWTRFATAVTNTGASPYAYPVAVTAAIAVWFRTRQWRAAVAAPAVLVLGVLSRLLLSTLVRDDRPVAALRLVPVHGFSFPSGHATASALLAGSLIWLLARASIPRLIRWILSGALGLWALAVALSRLYLGVHWISDVAGSWLLAAAWLLLLPLIDRPALPPVPAPDEPAP